MGLNRTLASPSRPRLAGWLATAVAIGLVVLTGLSVIALQGRARSSLETSRLASDVRAAAADLSILEWRATADGIDPATAVELSREKSQMLQDLATSIPTSVAGSDTLRSDVAAYTTAITRQLTALAQGRPELAAAIDEEQVDPAYDRLGEDITAVIATTRSDARSTARIGDIGSLLLLGLSAMLLGAISFGIGRSRRAIHRAHHDALTGLPNRTLLTERLEAALERRGRGTTSLGLVFLDIDEFKTMNDSLGHQAGDELLEIIAGRLTACARPGDTVARFGGDEFVILLDHVDTEAEAHALCRRIAAELNQPAVIAGRVLTPRATIGFALADDAAPDVTTLMRNADLAMYAGKHECKGSITAFAPEMHRRLLRQIEIDDALEGALDRNELTVHYQPLVDLDDGRILGTEALLRWTHPTLGTIPPLQFIPSAERSGAIHAIGEWVLNEACRQTAQWQTDRPLDPSLSVSVNVSAVQLMDDQFSEHVRAALASNGLEARYLTLEITESVISESNPAIQHQLQRLDGLGVTLAIDDFGTGYSSLSTLHQFPISVLKIDKSFIDSTTHVADRHALLSSIVEMGRSLGLRTVAEGVELPDQVETLRDLGCAHAQGFHFARPLASESLAGLLQNPHLPEAREIATPATDTYA